MLDTMTRWLEGVNDVKSRFNLRHIFEPLVDRYSSQPLTSAGLVISGTVLAKTGAADFYAVAGGTLVKIAAGTNMPSLTGLNVTATLFNVICFFIDSASVVTVAMGTEGAALANVVFPTFTKNKALVGFIIVNYASTFTGGTTHLDTAGVVYVSPLGPFDPSVLI